MQKTSAEQSSVVKN